jgi:hypothetical protein
MFYKKPRFRKHGFAALSDLKKNSKFKGRRAFQNVNLKGPSSPWNVDLNGM